MREAIKKKFDLVSAEHFTPKQIEALEAVKRFRFVLYGGAMGGGKSYWLRWTLINLLLYFGSPKEKGGLGIPHVTVGLFCEDYPALKDRHLSKIRYEFPEELGTFKSTDHNFVMNKHLGSGTIAFRNLDDASKYQSSEFASIAVDELTKNSKETFDYLRTRLRWPGIKRPRFLAATNPGSNGSEWVKKLWIKREFDPSEKDRDEFMYIPARAADNPYLSHEYIESLQGLPEAMRRAFLEGDWDVFQGQFFTEWRQDMHVCRRKELLPQYRKFICGDYGYAKPSAVYWCYIDKDGVLNAYRELYEIGLTYRNLGKRISEMTPENEKIEYVVWDPAIWAKKGENDEEVTGAELIEAGWKESRDKPAPMFIRGDNSRILGWNLLREYLKQIVGPIGTMSRFQAWDTCPELIRTLPSLIYDPHHPEDLDSDGEDHAADAIRYGIMSRPSASPNITTDTGSRVGRLLNRDSNQKYERPSAIDSFE